MTDTQEYCCASGVCCGDEKRLRAMAHLLVTRTDLSAPEAARVAAFLAEHFDMLPKAAGLQSVVSYIQAHPYRD